MTYERPYEPAGTPTVFVGRPYATSVVDRKRADDDSDESHQEAARAFVRRVTDRSISGLEELYLFGSTVRGDASGLASDVDFLAVVSESADRSAIENELRDVAYDVMLEYGPVVEVHVLTRPRFAASREQGDPFLRRVVREGKSYV